MKLLAHNEESGEKKALEEHLRNVAANSRKIVEETEFELDEDLPRFVEILGLCHDFGKANTLFQDYLDGKDISDKKKQHSLISAYYAFNVLKEEGFSEKLQVLGWLIILKHHGDLENLFGGKTGEIKKKIGPETKDILKFQVEKLGEETEPLYQQLGLNYLSDFRKKIESGNIFQELKEIYRKQARERFDKKPETFFLTLFCYSVLLDSDKMDTAGFDYDEWPSVGTDPVEISEDVVDNYKSAQGWDAPESKINRVREEAYEKAERIAESDEDLITLTLPTGAGKTLTALNLALKLRSKSDLQRPPRIIYSLPFLSIIDQNYDVIQDVLENEGLLGEDIERPELLLRHDHLSPGYAASESDDENPGNPILLTEGWNAEIVNTTFVQFFETLFSTKNSQARKFHKITNSIILLDEIQSLPIKYWKPVEEAFKVLAEQFNSKIVLMTATQPELIEAEDSEEAIPRGKKEEYFEAFDRVDYEFDLELNDLEDLADEVKSEAETEKDLMAVMNTKSSAKELYEELNQIGRRIIFLSTDILPKHRDERIKAIKEASEPVLVVTTQLIEAGVDIDMDIVWRDFAPLDSLVQTAGRCNREDSDDKGLVKIIKLEDEHGMAYCNYVYTGDSDSGLIGYTQEVIEEFSRNVSEAEFNKESVKRYFDIVNERKNQDHEDVLKNVKELNFSDIDVSLIENIRSVPIFVHAEGSEEVYEKVNEAYDKPYFERRNEMQELKSEFHSFIVNARIYGEESDLSGLPRTEFSDNFREIEQSKIGKAADDWYHHVTGFQIPGSNVGDRIL